MSRQYRLRWSRVFESELIHVPIEVVLTERVSLHRPRWGMKFFFEEGRGFFNKISASSNV